VRPLAISGILAAALAAVATAQETPPRHVTGAAVHIGPALTTISGVRELPNGHLLVSDARRAAVYDVDPGTGAVTELGAAGGDERQYAQPGGFYAAAGDTTLLLDRGLAKVLVIDPAGRIVGARSIKQSGITSSSDDDVDHQRVDARALAYFTTWTRFRRGAAKPSVIDSIALLRFDAARQRAETVTALRQPEVRIVQATENMELSQEVLGTPADEWGVAPDGRVAVVRGNPYHVEWYSRDGRATRGPAYAIAPIAFAQAEKDSIAAAARRGGGASAAMTSGPAVNAADKKLYFADTKAAFARNDVIVAPSGEVWVRRSQAYGTSGTTYDVFDGEGRRIDRVLLAGHVRVIGFGKGRAYAVDRDGGRVALVKFTTARPHE
jgi:hypothetical protein